MKRIVKHPRYSQTNYDNDIALVQLDKPVKFEGILNPVCLATPGKSFTGNDGVNCKIFIKILKFTKTFFRLDCHGLGNFKRRVIKVKRLKSFLID